MKNIIIAVVLVAVVGVICFTAGFKIGFRGGHADGFSDGYDEGVKSQKELVTRTLAAPHKYRFERNGASLWRYDETNGTACQIESSVADNWAGGRCPVNTVTGDPTPSPMQGSSQPQK